MPDSTIVPPEETKVQTGGANLCGRESGRLATNSIWNLSGWVVTLVLNFVAAPITIRQLGPDAYGIFSLLLTVITPLGLFDLGLGEATVKYMAEGFGRNAPKDAESYFRSTMMFNLCIGVSGAVVLFALTPWIIGSLFNVPDSYMGAAKVAMYMIGLNWALTMVNQTYIGALTALQDYRVMSVGGVLMQAGTLLVGIVVLLRGGSLLHLVFSQTACLFVGTLGWRYAVRRALPTFKLSPHWNIEAFRRTVGMGVWQTGNKLGGLFAGKAQYWLLGAILPVATVGYYNLCCQIISIVYLLSYKIGQVLFPNFSFLHGSGRENQAAQKAMDATWICSAIALPGIAAMLFVGPDILSLWVGKSVAAEAGSALRILSAANGVSLIFAIPSFYLMGTGRTHWLAVMSVVQGAVSFAAGLYLVPALGLNGAALSVGVGVLTHLTVIILIWARIVRKWIYFNEYIAALYGPLIVAMVFGVLAIQVRKHITADLGLFETGMLAVMAALLVGGVILMLDGILPGGTRRRGIYLSLIKSLTKSIVLRGKPTAVKPQYGK